jgi:hypothetical protein
MKTICSVRRAAAAASTLVLALALAGCSDDTKKTFGLEPNPPDAFQVGTQAPLALPPELGQLPQPLPGEPRPQQVDAGQAGADILSPQSALTAAPANITSGEQALLEQAGPTPPANIRAQVNEDALIASKSPGFVSSLMGNSPAAAPTVNAAAEQKRLQENAALGQPTTKGATPQDSNEKPGLLQRVLNLF